MFLIRSQLNYRNKKFYPAGFFQVFWQDNSDAFSIEI